MSIMGAVIGEVGHHWRVFWRNPLSAFFTVALPLMFLLLFNLLNADARVLEGVRFAQFFTPAIAVFAMVTAGFTSLAITTSMDRDEGILKREVGTPMPPWLFVAGRVGAAIGTGLVSVVLMMTVGIVVFGVEVLWERLPLAVLVLLVGAACFSALGLAVAAVAPNGRAASAIANAVVLPLAFVSGIFFPLEAAPSWVETIASVFPLRPFVVAFGEQWNPSVAAAFPGAELAVLIAWGAAGAAVAALRFSWEPPRVGRPTGRRPQTPSRR